MPRIQTECPWLLPLIDQLQAEIAALSRELDQYRATGGGGGSAVMEEELNEIEEEVRAINEGGSDGIYADCAAFQAALQGLQVQLNTLSQQIAQLNPVP